MKTTDKLAMLIAAAGLATSFSAYADEGEVNLAQVA
ncbi:hypothetical protein J2T37_001052 [Neisseria perflava]|nr:hypothetical protein [Neisseria perflava]MCP1772754.1 hypothetical protein [Neisseria perflava]